MLTEKDFCDLDTSHELWQMGLEPEAYYDGPIILLYEAQKWLRETKDVLIIVCPYTYDVINKTHTWTYEIWFGDNLEYEIHDFKSYEEALSEGIKKAVKILKKIWNSVKNAL